MTVIPEDLHYTEAHEWVRTIGSDTVRVGITDHAQDQLGDVVFVELPEVGTTVVAGREFGEVESTKSTSDLLAPIDGEVVSVNAHLVEAPELVNTDPYGAGWMLEVRLDGGAEAATADLLDAAGYGAVIA